MYEERKRKWILIFLLGYGKLWGKGMFTREREETDSAVLSGILKIKSCEERREHVRYKDDANEMDRLLKCRDTQRGTEIFER